MPRTRPAGVRRTATGVVSGVGGAGSGERIWVACSECFTFEQPAPSGQTAKASKRSETDPRFVPNPNRRARTDFVARRAATMTEFDGGRTFEHRKSLKFNGESTQPLMVWRLILSVPKKSAGMGVPAWGGVEGFPPLFFRRRSRESAGSPSEAKRRLRDDLILDEARERSQVLALPGDSQLERIALVLLFEHAKRGARGGYRAGVRVGDFQRESMGLGAGPGPDRAFEGVHALTGQCGNADLAAVGPRSRKIGLVPDGNDAFRLDPEIIEHIGRDPPLFVDARRGGVEHVQHDVGVADLRERRAEGRDQRGREL